MQKRVLKTRKIGLRVVWMIVISLGLFGRPLQNRHIFTVLNEPLTETPISPLIYSNFIELGYGIQAEAMWSEMLFNRSFEQIPPYTGINKECFDLFLDGGMPGKVYARDWSRFDWYHSGYEHNAWFAAPGENPPATWIDDTCTFFVNKSVLVDCEIRPMSGGSGHGSQCLQVINNESEKWAGVAQTGKFLRKGERYRFRGKLRSFGDSVKAEIRFFKTGEWNRPIASFLLNDITGDFSERRLIFDNTDYTGWATFCIMIPPQSEIVLDDFSLQPESAVHGWRRDVVDALKRVKPGLIRFPGGCFASFYDWRDGIGLYSERIPNVSYFWGGLNYNDVGTAEFAMLCKSIGAQMMFCVNVYHPWKQSYDHYQGPLLGRDFPQFTSLSNGAKSAADWVAYCNLPEGTHPMADLRVQHGYKEPFDVRYWEMDNEVSRWFTAEDYAWAVHVYATAMKAVDPSIKVGMVCYGGGGQGPVYREHLDEMLDIAGDDIDFLADRNDAEEGLDMMLEYLKKYNSEHGTDIQYCNTEWLPLDFECNTSVYETAAKKIQPTRSYMFSKWHYGLNVLKNLLAFQRRGGDVLFVNFNNLANTHSQSAIETPKEGVYLTASGMALELLSHSPASKILKIKDYTPTVADEFQVQAAWDDNQEKLVLFICNRTFENQTAVFDLSEIPGHFTKSVATSLKGSGPLAMNTLKHPEAIRQIITQSKNLKIRKTYVIETDPYTFVQVVLER